MANVLNKITKEYKKSVNTPDYDRSTGKYWDDGNWIINPDEHIINAVPQEYWVIGDTTLREMTADERAKHDWTHKSEVYIISTKELLQNKNADDYIESMDAIVNPEMPSGADMIVEPRFTEVVEGVIVEMSKEDKDAIKAAEDEAKAAEDEAKKVVNAENIRKENIAAEVANKYSIEEQIRITFKLSMGILQPEDDEAVGLANALNEAEFKYTA